MYRRPEGVMAIGILCIIFGAISCLGMLLMINNSDLLPSWMASDQKEKYNILMVVGSCDSLVTLLCGIFMLKGENWARWVFVIEAAISTAVLAYISSDNLAPLVTTFGFRAICAVILFLPSANEYYGSRRRGRW